MKEKVLKAYEKLANAYNAKIDFKPHNAFYDRPNTLSLLPDDISNKVILDAGCGPGKYAEILLERGAEVIGFDLSPSMIELAIKRNSPRGRFFVHDLSQPINEIANESVDFVVCALVMDYLEDWEAPLSEFNRVLKKGGSLVMSFQHPFFEYTFFKAENYFSTELVSCTWNGFGLPVEVHSFRRSLQSCLIPLVENGFIIDRILEPLPIPEFEKHDARHYKELNEFPSFMCIRGVKR